MRLVGLPVPTEWNIPLATPLIFLAFFVAAAGEELGYMGYVIEPMQARWSALTTGLIAGSLWALWHFPSMIQLGQTPLLVTWGFLATVAFRILYIWLYNNTNGSVFGVILFHAISNTGRTIFPGGRSHFELANAVVGYSMIVAAAVIVIFLWGPRTLARYKYSSNKS
jgi:membrane protease YdiL (CAAX protease family)